MPAGQETHALAPEAENWPAAQLAQLDPPDDAWNVPATQFVQPLDPATDTMPAKQSAQLESPTVAAYLPVEHAVQLAAPAAEYLPVTQDDVTALRPAEAQYEPAVHASHELRPAVA